MENGVILLPLIMFQMELCRYTLMVFFCGSATFSGTHRIGSFNLAIGGVGVNGFGATYYMSSIYDAMRFYSRALTAAEVLANYQAGNIEFQTRTSADGTTWEAWKPVTNETTLDSVDSLSPVEKSPKPASQLTGSG